MIEMKSGKLSEAMWGLGRDYATSDEWARSIEKLEYERDEARKTSRYVLRVVGKKIEKLEAQVDKLKTERMGYKAEHDTARAEVERLRAEVGRAKGVQQSMGRWLKHIAPGVEPLEDFVGLSWQVDNAIAGLRAEVERLNQEIDDKFVALTLKLMDVKRERDDLMGANVLVSQENERLRAMDKLAEELINFLEPRTLILPRDMNGLIKLADYRKAHKALEVKSDY